MLFKVDQHSVLSGLNYEDSAVKFYELKNDEKNICLRICFSAIAHLQKAPITARLETVPDSRYFDYG